MNVKSTLEKVKKKLNTCQQLQLISIIAKQLAGRLICDFDETSKETKIKKLFAKIDISLDREEKAELIEKLSKRMAKRLPNNQNKGEKDED